MFLAPKAKTIGDKDGDLSSASNTPVGTETAGAWGAVDEDDDVDILVTLYNVGAPLTTAVSRYRHTDSFVAPWQLGRNSGRWKFVPSTLFCLVLVANISMVLVYQSNTILGLNRSSSYGRSSNVAVPAVNLALAPRARKLHAAASFFNDEDEVETMVIFGGLVRDEVLGDIWHYEYRKRDKNKSRTWHAPSPKVVKSRKNKHKQSVMSRFGHSASVAKINGTNLVFIFGGKGVNDIGDYTYFDDLWMYDPVTYTYIEVSPPGERPAGRYGHDTVVVNSDMYLVGGVGQGCTPQFECQDFWKIDLSNPFNTTWQLVGNPGGMFFTTLVASPFEYTRNGTVVSTQLLLAFGGYRSDAEGSRTFATDIQYYDVERQVWDTMKMSTPRTPPARWGHKMVLSEQGVFKMFGGLSGDVIDGYNDMWDLSLHEDNEKGVMGTWEPTNSVAHPPLPRFGHSFVKSDDNYYIFGGSRVDVVLGELWQYHSINSSWVFVAESKAEYYNNQHCFIATAAFGSGMHTNLYILRQFRDQVLVKTLLGRWLVEMYYTVSPPIAEWMVDKPMVRWAVRGMLWPIVATVFRPMEGLSVLAAACCGIYLAWLWSTARSHIAQIVRKSTF